MKQIFVFMFLLCLLFEISATHIVGGNFYIEQVGRNDFKVELKIFRNPSGIPIFTPVTFRIYNKADSTDFRDIIMNNFDLSIPVIGDDCFSPSQLEIEEYTFYENITLPDNSTGYLLVARICCRNYGLENVISSLSNPVGMTWTAEIPDPAITRKNSSPDLGPYPSDGFFCLNHFRQLDLSATDSDGDSLGYKLVTPISSSVRAPITFPPYSGVRWRSGYSLNNIIGGSPALSIDSVSGMLISKPEKIGVFVFSYIVSEYRNGVKIGEVRRDVQFESLDCTHNLKPIMIQPTEDNWTLDVNRRLCEDIEIIDPNSSDSIYLSISYKSNSSNTPISEPQFPTNVYGHGSISNSFCWTPDCLDGLRKSSVTIYINAYSFGCDNTVDTVFKKVTMEVLPQEESIKNLIPNVFTPNNDGLNDYFTLGHEVDYLPCLESLNFKVFNRWGMLVYETSYAGFKWDGSYKSNLLQQGVYYYIMQGYYGGYSFEIKDFLSLL